MSTCFQGAALYSNVDIKKSLEGFSVLKETGEKLLSDKIKIAEDSYSPSRLRKFISGESLYSRWSNLSSTDKWFYPYPRWVVMEGYVELAEEDREHLSDLNVVPNPWSDRDEGIFIQLSNLSGTGKDCYLNPEQSYFIRKYSED